MNIRDSVPYIEKYFKVLSKPDAQGIADLVPMKLWRAQRYFIENKTHRNVCVKPRQVGFSTAELGDNAHALFTIPYERQTVIAHDDETAQFLLGTVTRFHRNLPPEMQPFTDWKSGSHIRFPKLDSYIYIDSAKSDTIGIGHGLTRVHLSEVARYPPRKADQLFADISQTVSEGGYLTLESTPQGRGGLFYRLYDAAKRGEINYKAFFFPWWWDENYQRLVPISGLSGLKYDDEEKLLVNNFNLTPEQIQFRREKIAEIKDLFYQEYPENDTDCWLMSNISVFDGVAIRRYLMEILSGKEEGNLTIWKDVIGGEKYVIGVDAAGGYEKGDYSVASVLRVRNNEYVTRLRAKIPPDLFAQELLRLGKRFNDAEIGIERESFGYSVLRILLENNYPNIYHYEDFDHISQLPSLTPGWKTSGKSKPIMISTLNASLRAHDIMSYSENLMMEASGLIWEGERVRKSTGGYDDEVDAFMIALQIRNAAPIIESTRPSVQSYSRL